MKIGILTFHWATNYGAVLQAYALQIALADMGHEVYIINYKPEVYNDSLYNFISMRKYTRPLQYIQDRKKEYALNLFRNKYLNLTGRVNRCSEIPKLIQQYDLIISGSDQVGNPYFLLGGEGRNTITPSYYLGFDYSGYRVAYAMSFGCTIYPESAREVASKYLQCFDFISVREQTGINIVKEMGRLDVALVPDPTLLHTSSLYRSFISNKKSFFACDYIYFFILRNVQSYKKMTQTMDLKARQVWNNENGAFSMESWLQLIANALLVITDSFHCVVMCLKFHKRFIVLTELRGNDGMNDRFYSLLQKIGLASRIVEKQSFDYRTYSKFSNDNIDWEYVDAALIEFASAGKSFLNNVIANLNR